LKQHSKYLGERSYKLNAVILDTHTLLMVDVWLCHHLKSDRARRHCDSRGQSELWIVHEFPVGIKQRATVVTGSCSRSLNTFWQQLTIAAKNKTKRRCWRESQVGSSL